MNTEKGIKKGKEEKIGEDKKKASRKR